MTRFSLVIPDLIGDPEPWITIFMGMTKGS